MQQEDVAVDERPEKVGDNRVSLTLYGQGSKKQYSGPSWEQTRKHVADYRIVGRKRLEDARTKPVLKRARIQSLKSRLMEDKALKENISSTYNKQPWPDHLDLKLCLQVIREPLARYFQYRKEESVAFVMQRFTTLGLCFRKTNGTKSYSVARRGNIIYLWKESVLFKDGKGQALERLLVPNVKGEYFRVVQGQIGEHALFCTCEIDAWENNEPVEIKLGLYNREHDYFQAVNVGVKKIWFRGYTDRKKRENPKMCRVFVKDLPAKFKDKTLRNAFQCNLEMILDQLRDKVVQGTAYKLSLDLSEGKAWLEETKDASLISIAHD